MIINEKELKKDMINALMDEYDYSIEDAEEWCDTHLEYCIEEMFEAESSYISNNVESR